MLRTLEKGLGLVFVLVGASMFKSTLVGGFGRLTRAKEEERDGD